MEQLKQMKEMLIGVVQGQLTHLDSVDAKELGEAVDMIKDIAETEYYCAIVKSMEESEKSGKKETMYYPVMMYQKGNTTDGRDASRGGQGSGGRRNYEEYAMMYPMYYRDMDRMEGRMYYGGGSSGGSGSGGSSGGQGGNSGGSGSSSSSGGSSSRNYSEREMPFGEMMRDSREGRSPMSRKNYMESKQMHKDKASQMQELEKYMQELSSDITEMIADASPEEKQLLSNRIATLSTKIK